MGLLPKGIDILPPSDDRIFKLILSSAESEPVLADLISATIKRKVVRVAVRNNDIPPGDTEEKAERLDVNCQLDDGTQVDLEMQASYIEEIGEGHNNLKGKSIYYLCDLHSSQSSKGRRYDELAQTYQVTFCSYTVFPDLPNYVNPFSMRHDVTNEPLSDAITVIYVELSKLGKIIEKSVGDMTDLEKWAVFFRYADVPEYRETVNKVIESKEALQMAGDLLMSVSQSERERAIFRSRRMFQSDNDSNLATAEARGRQAGETAKAFDIAKKMLKRNRPLSEIIEDTGLTRTDIESLRQ
jgi:predicted transposase/invertase (TIGR01784 family)